MGFYRWILPDAIGAGDPVSFGKVQSFAKALNILQTKVNFIKQSPYITDKNQFNRYGKNPFR